MASCQSALAIPAAYFCMSSNLGDFDGIDVAVGLIAGLQRSCPRAVKDSRVISA
jgi:hypothetical protein